jgi:hypothetical protein
MSYFLKEMGTNFMFLEDCNSMLEVLLIICSESIGPSVYFFTSSFYLMLSVLLFFTSTSLVSPSLIYLRYVNGLSKGYSWLELDLFLSD